MTRGLLLLGLPALAGLLAVRLLPSPPAGPGTPLGTPLHPSCEPPAGTAESGTERLRRILSQPPGACTGTVAARAPEPIQISTADGVRTVRLDALIRYGATPLGELCGRTSGGTGPADAAALLDAACGRGDGAQTGTAAEGAAADAATRAEAALDLALQLLPALEAEPGEGRRRRMRDVNGLILAGVPAAASSAVLSGLAWTVSDAGQRAGDGRIFDIASELALAARELCAGPDGRCRIEATLRAGTDLTNAGRWLNDADRLRRAGEMLEAALAQHDGAPDEEQRYSLLDAAGRAYGYAASFADPQERLPLTQRSIGLHERLLPLADAKAPSFRSAMVWNNLGASYGDRAAMTGDQTDLERSVALYERAIAFFAPVDYRRALARARSNMGDARTGIARGRLDLAAHDAALRDLRESVAGFEAGEEALDIAHTQYRLAGSLGSKAGTADILAGRLTPAEEEQRAGLLQAAKAARTDALGLLGHAIPVFEQARAEQYLSRARAVQADLRQALDRAPQAAGRSE